MTHQPTETPQFYLTAPAPCPYLAGRFERKVFTHLVGDRAGALNDILTQGGFRRSQNIAYRPACEGCRSCISVRTVVDAFRPTASMRRVTVRNRDLTTSPFYRIWVDGLSITDLLATDDLEGQVVEGAAAVASSPRS